MRAGGRDLDRRGQDDLPQLQDGGFQGQADVLHRLVPVRREVLRRRGVPEDQGTLSGEEQGGSELNPYWVRRSLSSTGVLAAFIECEVGNPLDYPIAIDKIYHRLTGRREDRLRLS